MSSLAKTDYYEKVADSLMDDFTSLGIPGGIPDEVFEKTVTQDRVKTEIMDLVEDSFAGKSYTIRSNAVKQELYTAFLTYGRELYQHDPSPEEQEALQQLASLCEDAYKQHVRVPFLDQILSVRAEFNRYFPLAAAFLIVLSAVLAVIIWRLQRWHHRAIRQYVYAGIGCSLAGMLLPLVLLIQAPYKHLNIMPLSFYNLLCSLAEQYLLVLVITFLMVGLLCTIFRPIYRKLKNKVS